MQKKMVGILAGVASVHAVLLAGLMASGGCSHSEILAPHSYVDGPDLSQSAIPAAAEQPSATMVDGSAAPVLPGNEPAVEPIVQSPAPVAPVAAPEAAQGGTYTVKAGDTLSAIAYRHGVRTSDLAACNNLSGKAVNNLKVGQKLTIPAGGTYTAPKAAKTVKTTKSTKTASTKAAKAERPADGIYVVKKGDTLDRIARRYGTTGRAIAAENNIDVTKTLHIGDKLRLPAAGAAAVSTPASPAAPATSASLMEPEKLGSNVGDDLTPEVNAAAPATPATPAAPADMNAPDAAPAAPASAAPTVNTELMEVSHDMTLKEFSSISGVDEATLRRLNPNLPADGKIKAGSFMTIPQLPPVANP